MSTDEKTHDRALNDAGEQVELHVPKIAGSTPEEFGERLARSIDQVLGLCAHYVGRQLGGLAGAADGTRAQQSAEWATWLPTIRRYSEGFESRLVDALAGAMEDGPHKARLLLAIHKYPVRSEEWEVVSQQMVHPDGRVTNALTRKARPKAPGAISISVPR